MKDQLEKAAERLDAENAPGVGATKSEKVLRNPLQAFSFSEPASDEKLGIAKLYVEVEY